MNQTKLIIGLGNVGSEHTKTRHNAGFMAVDYLANEWAENWSEKRNLEAYLARSVSYGLILAKPTTMMNNSGRSVAKLMNFYKISTKDVIIIHDDADLSLGEIRTSDSTQTGAGHHGVISVAEAVGPGFMRIRIGIGRPQQPQRDISGYVLQQMTEDELNKLKQSLIGLERMIINLTSSSE